MAMAEARTQGVTQRQFGIFGAGRVARAGEMTSMPLRNRVTPFGEIVAIRQRGLFIGNRGIIHDPATKTLLRRRWSSKAWLICRLDYKDIRRDVMAKRSWTELFFLDEATALAAGHRPCFLCRREAALKFQAAWAAGNGLGAPRAAEMDTVLHGERTRGGGIRQPGIDSPPEDLPDGAMVAAGDRAFVIAGGKLFRWTSDFYREAEVRPIVDRLITPPSTLAALRAGYRPVLHPSVATCRTGDR
jgi:hypothetical protein